MKLYEYVGAARPIIAFGAGEHVAGRVVADRGLGVRLHDAAGLQRCLEELVAGDAALPAAAGDARERFDRDASLRLLASIVDAL
jgi:hypothetical protein